MNEEPECIGMCEFDPESGVCLGCGRLPECTAACTSVRTGKPAADSNDDDTAALADWNT